MAFCWCIQPAHKKDLRRIVVRECAVVQPQRISLVLPYRATTGIPLAGEIISHREAALPQLLLASIEDLSTSSKYTITIRDTYLYGIDFSPLREVAGSRRSGSLGTLHPRLYGGGAGLDTRCGAACIPTHGRSWLQLLGPFFIPHRFLLPLFARMMDGDFASLHLITALGSKGTFKQQTQRSSQQVSKTTSTARHLRSIVESILLSCLKDRHTETLSLH
ncbi:MAG: hypothetical protein L6R35_001670 [Caloplaca aegaea]|nr:MAG: hypothetical protein L6R35_001670 [Caloplaca aegaea]